MHLKKLEELLKKTTRAQIKQAVALQQKCENVQVVPLGKNTKTVPAQREFFAYNINDVQEKTLSFSEPILECFKGDTHFKYFKPKAGWKFRKNIFVGEENRFQYNYTLQIITQGYVATTKITKPFTQKNVLLQSYNADIRDEPFANNILGAQQFLECYVKRPSDNRVRWSYFPVQAQDAISLKQLLQ